jgi:hypothetical protein
MNVLEANDFLMIGVSGWAAASIIYLTKSLINRGKGLYPCPYFITPASIQA